MISWFFFENSNETDNKINGYGATIPDDADIRITSSLYLYKVLPLTQENNQSTTTSFEHDTSPIVLIDELYRPGVGVELKRNFYGAWHKDFSTDKAEMLSFIESTYAPNIVPDFHLTHKRNGNSKPNLFVTNSEKWERRKDLTGVILKTTTVAV